jgi:hypothetical protein
VLASPDQKQNTAGAPTKDRASEDPWFKLKAFAVIETVLFLIALVMPVTPSKTGRPFEWPATWSEYFEEVLLAFALGHLVALIIFIGGWIYIRRRGE